LNRGCRRRARRFGFLTLERVDRLDHEEYRERNDHEADDGLDEQTVIEGDRRRIAHGLAQRHAQAGKIHAADEQAQRWRNDVRNQRRHDLAEGRADNKPHGQIDGMPRTANALNSLRNPMIRPGDDNAHASQRIIV